MAAKSSAYVFPFRPFRNLSQSEPTIRLNERKSVQSSFFQPMLDIISPQVALPEGERLEDRIVALFASDKVRFGSREWITDLAQHWAVQARYFIERDEPILFARRWPRWARR